MHSLNNNDCGCSNTTTTYTHCNQCAPETPCDCAVVDLSTNCVLYNDDNIECDSVTVITKNINLTDNLKNLVSWACGKFSEVQNYFKVRNIGDGSEIYAGDNLLGEKQLRTLTSEDNSVTITQNENTIDFSVEGGSDQNNFVRNIQINIDELPEDFNGYDIVDYILALPPEERTITETDSKFNVLIMGFGDGNIIYYIYEIQNHGKGIIEELYEEDLLLIGGYYYLSPFIATPPHFGIYIRNRYQCAYGEIGSRAFDVSISADCSSTSNRGATGDKSFACNNETTSSGEGSFADGDNTIASGRFSKASGNRTTSKSFVEQSGGQFNTSYTPTSVNSFVSSDRLINYGNGSSTENLSDAYLLYKSGLPLYPSLTTAMIGAESTGRAVITREYLESQLLTIDGSETKVTAGTNISVTGTGTTGSPYIVTNTMSTPDGSETKINSGTTTTVSGNGTIATPYTVETVNLQKTIPASNYILSDIDNKYLIFIDNGATDITITVPSTVVANFEVGFLQMGTGDVSFITSGSAIIKSDGGKLKIGGENLNAFIARREATNDFHLNGSIKV